MESENEQLLAEELEEQQLEKGDKVQLIVFKLGKAEYALTIDQIKEVVLTPRISEMPQTPDYVIGIANIRGNVISIMDFEKKFGLVSQVDMADDDDLDEDGKKQADYSLVIESEKYNVGIQVKHVPDTLTITSSKIDSSSNIMQHSSLDESVIRGIVKVKDRMIILVDVIKMLETGDIKTKL